MAVTGFKQGNVSLSSASQTLTISGLDFIPNKIMVGITSAISGSSYENKTIMAETGKTYTAYNNDGLAAIKAFTNSTFSYGKTTTIKVASTTNNWLPATYHYVAWREE